MSEHRKQAHNEGDRQTNAYAYADQPRTLFLQGLYLPPKFTYVVVKRFFQPVKPCRNRLDKRGQVADLLAEVEV